MPYYYTVAFTDTLMAPDTDLGVYVQSGDRSSSFYFRVPEGWATSDDSALQQSVYAVAQRMYADLNAGFRAAEPNDSSYMLVKATRAVPLDAATIEAKPWLEAPNPAVWEPTPCVIISEDGSYRKVTREEF